MKNFKQFVTEAVETSASAQAKKMGLSGDGHGDWYDKQGKLIAKTVDGKLKIFGGGGAAKKEEPAAKKPAAQQPAKRTAPAQAQPQQEAATGVVVVFGRFNPPTVGHEKLLNAASNESKRSNFDLAIYPSRTQDAKKNPLEPSAKIAYMKKMFPDFEEQIMDDEGSKTIFDVLSTVYNAGYKIGVLMLLVVNGFNMGWQPYFLEKNFDSRSKIYPRINSIVLAILGFIWILLLFWTDDLIKTSFLGITFFGSDFFGSLNIIPWIGLSYFFYGFYHLQTPGVFLKNRPKYAAWTRLFGAFSNIGLCFLLIPIFGALGAAYATCISFGLMALSMFFINRYLIFVKLEIIFEVIQFENFLETGILASLSL